MRSYFRTECAPVGKWLNGKSGEGAPAILRKGREADDNRPQIILAADRNMSGFDVTGMPDNINCFILNSPDTGARTAKWRRGVCHGENSGIVTLSDGSV